MKYFDAHCHIQFEQYDADREELLRTMQEQGVGGLVVGTDFESSRKAIELVQGRDTLLASIGLHPNAVMSERFDMVNRFGIGGIGIWALGYDDGYNDFWNLIQNIRSRVTEASSVDD